MTTLASDPFTRTTSPGLGSEPVTGQAWNYNTTNTAYSTTGTVARIATATIGQLYYATVDLGRPDHVVRHTFTVPVVPLGAAITLRVPVRWLNELNYYEAQLTIPTAGQSTLTLSKRIANVASSLSGSANVGTHAAGNAWTVECEVFGTTIRAKAWNASTATDPLVYQVSAVASDTAIQAATAAGFGCRRETGNTNGTVSVDGDNFTASTLLQVDQQAVYPPRTLVTVTGIQAGDVVSLYRSVSGVRTLVQGGTVVASDVALLRIDAQLPFGVPVSYVAVIGGAETVSPAVSYALPGGKVVASDAIAGLAAEVIIWAWPEKQMDRQATVFRVGGRNVVVSGSLTKPESDIELYVDATSSADNLVDLLTDCTQGIIQIRQPGGYDDVDGYYAVTEVRKRRYSQDGSDQKRIFTLHVVEVDGWADAFLALGFTYADLATAYTGLTYANLAADFPTYLALGQADLS